MQQIDSDQLARVVGGLNLDDLPESTNVEDRRGMTRRQSMHVRSPPAPPLHLPPRYPGDLPSQAGIDDIGKHLRKPRRH